MEGDPPEDEEDKTSEDEMEALATSLCDPTSPPVGDPKKQGTEEPGLCGHGLPFFVPCVCSKEPG